MSECEGERWGEENGGLYGVILDFQFSQLCLPLRYCWTCLQNGREASHSAREEDQLNTYMLTFGTPEHVHCYTHTIRH